MVGLLKGNRAIGTKWVYRNKKDDRGIVVRNKASLVAQGYTQEEGIDYDEVFAPVARIETIRLFFAYASFMGHIVYQMDVKSAFLFGTIKEEVYVCQPPGFEDPRFPDKVYKVEKALDGLHQAPRAWYETLSTYLLENGYKRGTIDKTLFIKKDRDDATMRCQMSSIGFQVTPKVSHLHAVKRIFRYLKGQPKLGLWYPRDSPFDLEAFSDSDYAGASLDRKSTTGGCQFLGKRLISWQCKKQTIVANSTTEAEYVAAANCCGQVLWIQNQMLDYGFNFMNTKIHIDNESTICIVKNPVFHSKTKHIEIRHHFIRDSYEKRLIQVIKIHTDHNVADLLTKVFDVSSDEFGVKTGSCKVNAARQDLVLLGEINNVKQIHAIVDGKTVVISESSVRSDLLFNDEDGITCLTNETIFENLALMGVPIPNVADEAVFKEWDDRVVRATTTAASLDAAQASGNITKTQSMTMSNDPLSQKIGLGDRPTPRIHGGVIAQTRSERASKHSYDSPLLGVNTPGSDEERIEHQELTDNIPPTPHASPLLGGYTPGSDEEKKDAQAVEILKLKNKIKKLERKAKSSIPPPKRRLYKQIDSSDDSLGEENASKQGRNDSNKTEEFNLSDKVSGRTEVFDDTTAAEKDVNAAEPVSTASDAVTAASVIPDIDTAGPSNEHKTKNNISVIRDVEEESRRATPVPTVQSQDKGKRKIVEPEPTPKNLIKAQIQRDAEIAQILFEEDQAQFEREQRIARERATEQEAKDADLIAEFNNVQARMEADALLAARLKEE
ncbi:putative ribonuclease H-like domain-containing protein [Tanacetum coccineum]|uniref:Ribonuclease H-like domain-containing protein n=1 Tax=Tanacetum coccineum TaxID=301880 RepID=A0ABQ4YH17_9ASTR